MTRRPAVALTEGLLDTIHGKVTHGLLRHSDRFRLVAVVSDTQSEGDAGTLMDGVARGVPLVPHLAAALSVAEVAPEVCIVGIATHGGRLTEGLRAQLEDAAAHGLDIVNGLHDATADDPAIAEAARRGGSTLLDLRRPKPVSELHFWSGEILQVTTPRIAVLGTDCALGKRTTSRWLVQALVEDGVKAEMIYTGQTGWMQGSQYGFVLDATPNDFVCGELEHAILTCAREAHPDVMILEGQSSLRNPSGPCGSELLLAGGARGVVLQHAPFRPMFEGLESLNLRIPPVEDEVDLIRRYGAEVLAVTLNEEGGDDTSMETERQRLETRLSVPVVRPLKDGVSALLPTLRQWIEDAP